MVTVNVRATALVAKVKATAPAKVFMVAIVESSELRVVLKTVGELQESVGVCS